MADCCNYECYGNVWGTRKRCSKCRQYRIYRCASCGVEIDSNKQIYCKMCIKFSRREIQKRIESRKENKERKSIYQKMYYRERIAK